MSEEIKIKVINGKVRYCVNDECFDTEEEAQEYLDKLIVAEELKKLSDQADPGRGLNQ